MGKLEEELAKRKVEQEKFQVRSKEEAEKANKKKTVNALRYGKILEEVVYPVYNTLIADLSKANVPALIIDTPSDIEKALGLDSRFVQKTLCIISPVTKEKVFVYTKNTSTNDYLELYFKTTSGNNKFEFYQFDNINKDNFEETLVRLYLKISDN